MEKTFHLCSQTINFIDYINHSSVELILEFFFPYLQESNKWLQVKDLVEILIKCLLISSH